jgi:hypothetical protein
MDGFALFYAKIAVQISHATSSGCITAQCTSCNVFTIIHAKIAVQDLYTEDRDALLPNAPHATLLLSSTLKLQCNKANTPNTPHATPLLPPTLKLKCTVILA